MSSSNKRKPIRPTVLTIAGNDCAGMAGLAADIRTQSILGIHTAPVVTANTAQNNIEVTAINPVSRDVLQSQLDAARSLPLEVVKTGLIASAEQVSVIAEFLHSRDLPLICDPVLSASSGDRFSERSLAERMMDTLFPKALLITPNLPEAEALTGMSIYTPNDALDAAYKLLTTGAKAVLIKGGHQNGLWCQDLFVDNQRHFWLSSRRLDTVNTRGTGCTLSSSIASAIALGYSLYDAVVIGKMAINQALRLGYGIETDHGPAAIQAFPDKQIDLPCLTENAEFPFELYDFAPCNEPKLGLYPVVDRASWIPRLAHQGVTTIQLRVKDLSGDDLEKEIHSAVQLATQLHCRLFINDYWELAIKHKAYGVHLGQEDLDSADITAIHKNGLRLGISTHCHYEVARAHSYKPSYIACGPVYHTNTKQMPWIPHDIEGLSYWRRVLNYPLVAIGGINRERIPEVATTGVDSIAMITAITLAENPEQTTREFIKLMSHYD